MKYSAHTVVGGVHVFTWDDLMIQIKVDRVHEHRNNTIDGELVIRTTAPGVAPHIHQARFNLTSSQARRGLAKLLGDERAPISADWFSILEVVCVTVLEYHRAGEPVVVIGEDVAVNGGMGFALNPVLLQRHPTLIYGDGGTMKSYLAVLFSVLMQAGVNAIGMTSQEGEVLYLDWETDAQEITDRAIKIADGMMLQEGIGRFAYRRCFIPLADDIDQIRRIVMERRICYLVVDSLGAATGGDIEKAVDALRFFRALRSLNLGSLLITHITKEAKGSRTRTPFGSAYFWNYGRYIWETRHYQEPEEDTVSVGLFNRKANGLKLSRPIGLEFHFTDELVTVTRRDIADTAGMEENLSDPDAILAMLKHGGMKSEAISKEIGKPDNQVRVVLGRLQDKGCLTKLPDGRWGLHAGQEVR